MSTFGRILMRRLTRRRAVSSKMLRFNDVGTLAFYWRTAITPYPRQVLTILFYVLGGAVIEMATVAMTVPLLDVLTAPAQSTQSQTVAIATRALKMLGVAPSVNVVIFFLVVVVSLLFVLRSALLLLMKYATANVAVRLRRSTKAALFEKFLTARYEEMSTRARGTVVNDINVPAESLTGAITQLSYFLSGMMTAILMAALLLYLSWRATMAIGLLAIGCVQGWRWYADARAAAHGRTLYALRGEQNKLQVDAIDGLKIVKAHGLERHMVRRQDALLAGEWTPELRLIVYAHGPGVVNEIVAILIVLGLGAAVFLMPQAGIRFSMLAAFLFAIRRIAPSLAQINNASVELNKYRRNLEIIDEVLRVIPQEPKGGAGIGRVEEVALSDVQFWYTARPDRPVLRGVTMRMRRGSVTAIVGSTGAGKSTIANLLLGLYEPRTGTITVNGVDLRACDREVWRRNIGYVSQDVFVFNATIRENIALGDERLSQFQIEWAARVAQLHEFIASLPEGYDTPVGDRGLRLSGGQCQRLAISRAIVRKPQLLIFDEATSALDTITERAVHEAIRTLHEEAISLIIAHRLSTVKEADQILVLRDGQIVEAGTHETLIQQNGAYAGLYQHDEEPAVTAER